jgi:hypothetical protein
MKNTVVKRILKGIYSAVMSFVSIFRTIFNKTRQLIGCSITISMVPSLEIKDPFILHKIFYK